MKNMEKIAELSSAFLSCNTDLYIKLLSDLKNDDISHPKFGGGLYHFIELDRYIMALKMRNIDICKPYVENGLKCRQAYLDIYGIPTNLNGRNQDEYNKIIQNVIEYRDDFGNNALIEAIGMQDIELINEKGKFDDYPLDHACILMNFEIVQYLIENGDNINNESAFHDNCLFWAYASYLAHPNNLNSSSIIRYLINNGVDQTKIDDTGRCAIELLNN